MPDEPTNTQVIPRPAAAPVRIISDDIWAALTIWLEAQGESFEGKVAVAEVIRNRLNGGVYGKTVASVVLAPYQFSCWNTKGNRLSAALLMDDNALYKDCMRAWQSALGGSKSVPSAVFYYNPAGVAETPTWAIPARLIAVIGHHRFYR